MLSLHPPFTSQNFGVVELNIRSATEVYLQWGQLARRFTFWITSKPGLGRLVNSVELKRQPFRNTDLWGPAVRRSRHP